VRSAGLLALLGGLVCLVVVLTTQGPKGAALWLPVFGLIVSITGALVTHVTSWSQQRPAAEEPASVEQLARAAEVLQAAVREQWRKEAEVRSLGDPDPMPVRWRLSDRTVMDHDERIASTRLRFAGHSDRIPALTDQFRKLRRRRLVIIGGAGSGKTTLAVQLLLQLLEGWQPEQPVPVLFSLASWDPHTQPRVQDWLATQLNQTYPGLRAFGLDIAQLLADQGRLLPVLDGLDEVPTERRGEVIDRLNASLHPDTGVIVTSRTDEYTETVHTGEVLTAAAVIESEPLTGSEATTYLRGLLRRQAGDSWQVVLAALRGGTAGALAEVVARPLGLWLLRVVYVDGRRDPQPLLDPGQYPDPAAIRHHLLQDLIPVAVRSRPPLSSGEDLLRPKRRHDPEQVRRWLTTVATELRDAQSRDWRWWQLVRHTFARRQVVLVFGLAVGLLFALVFGLMFGLAGGLLIGLGFGVLDGLLLGLAAGLVFALVGSDRDAPAHTDFQLHGRAKALGSELARGLGRGLRFWRVLGPVFAAAFGLILGLVFWLLDEQHGPAFGLGIGLMCGLAVGLVSGLINFAASPSIARRASSPAESQRGDRRLTVLTISILGLAFGLAFGLAVGLVSGLAGGVVYGLVYGLVSGLLVGLGLGPAMTKTCWPTFVLALLWLAARRRLPVHLMGFLDDAYRLGLLRIVGPVYQFRHAALQDHLASPTESTATAAATSSPRGDV
jgi:hypothetical protein